MVRGMANERSDGVSQFLGHAIGDGTPARNNGPEGFQLCVFLGAHRTWEELVGGISSFVLESLSPPCDLMSLRVVPTCFFSLLVGSLLICL